MAPYKAGDFTTDNHFWFRMGQHDQGEKVVMGRKYVSAGMQEGKDVLMFLAKHPATVKHIAYELALRFVSDKPSPKLVERLAKTFQDTNGDIKAVMRMIAASPEF